MAKKKSETLISNIPLLLDVPITKEQSDEFGHRHYAQLLFELIMNDNYKPPYNIGLLGKWGVGKSSIKEMCRKNLNDREDTHCINFNAWKYGGDGIKRALLKHVYLELEGTDEEIRDEFSRQITKQILELTKKNELLKNIWNVIGNWLQIFAILYILFFGYKHLIPFMGELGQILTIVPFAILAGFVIKELLKSNNLLLPLFQNITKVDMPSTTAEAYEEFLKKQVEIFKNKHKKVTKIAVFVDDLDRLPTASEMIQGMNAIRAFMDLELPKNIGVIFVLSCCEYKIAEALTSIDLEQSEEDDKQKKKTQVINRKVEAKRFLDKIFQFRIDVPPFPYQDMISYTKTLLQQQIPDFNKFQNDLKERKTNIENLLCRLIHPKVQDPRQAIQIVNAFLQSWNIALQREGLDSNQSAGGLSSGIVTNHPLTLATLSVLKVDFPYFYKELLNEPGLLNFVLKVKKTCKMPLSTHIDEKIVSNFIEIIGFDDKVAKLREEYYELDQYLNILNNKFEFPPSLKPFLLLNQDPLSRKLGEDAHEIEQALLYGDANKIKKILGLNEETLLSKEHSELIKNVYESIYDAQRKNATKAILGLIDCITYETNFLLDSIIDNLLSENEYKELLNIENVKKLLEKADEGYSTKVLTIIDETFMQPISTDEEDKEHFEGKRQNFIAAANIKLQYYKENDTKGDEEFFKWIINPIIGKGEE